MGLEEAFEIAQVGVQVKRIADVLTASQKDVFIRLPGLEQYYPGGIRTPSGQLADHAKGGAHVNQVGAVPTGFDGDAYVHLGNGVNYFTVLNVGSITGTETYISSSIRGFTVGCWIMVDTTPPSAAHGIISRDGVAPQRGHLLTWDNLDQPRFAMSGTGAAIVSAVAPPSTTGVWHFIVGRFTPSTEVAVFVDGDKTVNTTAIPSSMFVSSQNFEVGRRGNSDGAIIHAKMRDMFICAAALEDDIIADLRANSLPVN